MQKWYIIVARQAVVSAHDSGAQQGELQPIRAADGEHIYFVNDEKAAEQYREWMVQHFGGEANYQVCPVEVHI